jgi:hypothetical protein
MKTRVMSFEETSIDDLEDAINGALNDSPDVEVIDIKYEAHVEHDEQTGKEHIWYSALMIFKSEK